MRKINLKVKIIGLLILLVCLLITYIYILSNISHSLYGWITLGIMIIPFTYFSLRISLVYLKFCLNFMFENVQRSRLLFHLIFLPLTFLCLKYNLKEYNNYFYHNSTHNSTSYIEFFAGSVLFLFGYILAIGALLFSWSKKFENTFIKQIRRKLTGLGDIKCILNEKEYDVKSLYEELIKGDKMECDYQVFLDLLDINILEPRIKWKSPKAELIRFIFVIFDIDAPLDKNIDQRPIKTLISEYFVDKDGCKIIIAGNEISREKEKKGLKLEDYINMETFIKSFIIN